MNRVQAVRGLDSHLSAVLGRLRDSDINEIRSAYGEDPDAILEESWMCDGADRWALKVGDEVVGLFGVNPAGELAGYGIPWILGTDNLSKASNFLILKSRVYLEFMLKRYKVLVNYVDARNLKSLLWLKWSGFRVHDASAFGAEGLPFHMITMER
jgi:hypothetical protein